MSLSSSWILEDGIDYMSSGAFRASLLWTEDFNTGQDYDGILAVNPLS